VSLRTPDRESLASSIFRQPRYGGTALKQKNNSVLCMPAHRAGEPASVTNNGWTLVDFLFPADHAPVWSGSVNGGRHEVLAKTA
jgi:hypothetical protein